MQAVVDSMGVDPGDYLDSSNLPDLVKAIIQHENGVQPYPDATINQGVSMA